MRRMRWLGALAVGWAVAAASEPPGPPPLPKDTLPAKLALDALPKGLGERPGTPADNPLTDAKVALGRRLFFEPRLSADGTVACASCHDPARGFATAHARAVGIRGLTGRRNAPSLLNRAYGSSLFWDGRTATLEEQALKPIEDPNELGHNVAAAVKTLEADASYQSTFKEAFGDSGVTSANLAKALASFQRTLLHGDSKYDAFIDGRIANLNEKARHGLWLFESRGRCWKCHSGPNFSDEKFHNTGVSWGKSPPDLGRFEITKQDADKGRFKTPSLRGVALTAPYKHDGSIATLEEVIEFYNKGGNSNPNLDQALRPLGLAKEEIGDLVEFLKALSEPGAKKE